MASWINREFFYAMSWDLISRSIFAPDFLAVLRKVLYLKEVDTMLALVCITRSENFRKKSMINYNIGCLRKALRALAKPKETT